MISVKAPSNVTIDFPYKECENCPNCKPYVETTPSASFYGKDEHDISCEYTYVCKRWYDIVSTLLSEVKDEQKA